MHDGRGGDSKVNLEFLKVLLGSERVIFILVSFCDPKCNFPLLMNLVILGGALFSKDSANFLEGWIDRQGDLQVQSIPLMISTILLAFDGPLLTPVP